MSFNSKPKRTLIAYCALAERLSRPGAGFIQALTPFFAEVCHGFSGELFDAGKFSQAIAEKFGIHMPRLAALGLSEHLEKEGLLTIVSGHARSTVYQYKKFSEEVESSKELAVSEAEIDSVLQAFVVYCKDDIRLKSIEDTELHEAFLERLLHIDSMRLLSRKVGSNAVRRNSGTLILNKDESVTDPHELQELHLDFVVSEYLLDLRTLNPQAFDLVSDIAFANMAAEALACFNEPPAGQPTLEGLTVYLDSPLLLDALGVNSEYAQYGNELLDAIKGSGATAAVFDHSVAEAESVVAAQLAYLRSGINRATSRWGVTTKPDLLSALIGNVGTRASVRLGIDIHRDPVVNLHRRSPTVVGDIESNMTDRMQAWGSMESRDFDKKSVWSMLAIRDTSKPCIRICDSKMLLLARNTALVNIANSAWTIWLKGATRHSSIHIGNWAPIAMSDKQFAGYIWLRGGSHDGSISRSRLLAHCSAAVRPREDIKARAYNLILDFYGRKEADDVAALLEDREGARALMRATRGDPEDVTKERLPYILEKVKLAAGEFAAEAERIKSAKALEATQLQHAEELEEERRQAEKNNEINKAQVDVANQKILQSEYEKNALERQNEALKQSLDNANQLEKEKREKILQAAFAAGFARYSVLRWSLVVGYGILMVLPAWFAGSSQTLSFFITVIFAMAGFWFVPNYLEKPLHAVAMRRLKNVVAIKDASIVIPTVRPNFRKREWSYKNDVES